MTAPAWCLHVGAHKTGTTHVQEVLAAAQGALAAEGVLALPRRRARPLLAATFPRPGPMGTLGAPLAWARLMRLRGVGRGARRVVLCEENLLGPVDDLLAAPLYADPVRLRRVLGALPEGPLTLCLSIRSLARALPSAFYECLKASPEAPARFAAARRAAAADAPRWADLVRRMHALAPRARLVVWRQEDYARDPRPALGAMAGDARIDWPEVIAPSRTRSPAPTALAEVARLDPALPRRARRRAVLAIYARHPAGPGDASPLAPEEAAALDALYVRDVDAIREDGLAEMLAGPAP